MIEDLFMVLVFFGLVVALTTMWLQGVCYI